MSMPLRAAFVGDSLTLGIGDPEGLGWVGRLSASTRKRGGDLTAYNLGIRRDTSADIARRWEAETFVRLPSTTPRLVVFSFGTNDCLDDGGERRVPHHQSLHNAEAILRNARAFSPVLMVGPPPSAQPAENLRISALSEDLRLLCEAIAVPFIELFTPLHRADWMTELASSDGYHPGASGYELVARLVETSSSWIAVLDGRLEEISSRATAAARGRTAISH